MPESTIPKATDRKTKSEDRVRFDRERIQSLIFIAGFIFSSLLLVGSLSLGRIVAANLRIVANYNETQVSRYYFRGGLLTLLPWDLFMLAYVSTLFLALITLRVLAEAQRSLGQHLKRAEELTAKADKYVEWALTGTVFFTAFEFLSTPFFLRFVIFSTDFWPYLIICVGIALCVRHVMHRVINV